MGVRGWSSGEEGGGRWGGAERLVPEEKIHDPEHTFFFFFTYAAYVFQRKRIALKEGKKEERGKGRTLNIGHEEKQSTKTENDGDEDSEDWGKNTILKTKKIQKNNRQRRFF